MFFSWPNKEVLRVSAVPLHVRPGLMSMPRSGRDRDRAPWGREWPPAASPPSGSRTRRPCRHRCELLDEVLVDIAQDIRVLKIAVLQGNGRECCTSWRRVPSRCLTSPSRSELKSMEFRTPSIMGFWSSKALQALFRLSPIWAVTF